MLSGAAPPWPAGKAAGPAQGGDSNPEKTSGKPRNQPSAGTDQEALPGFFQALSGLPTPDRQCGPVVKGLWDRGKSASFLTGP